VVGWRQGAVGARAELAPFGFAKLLTGRRGVVILGQSA
jgi:hypothetical protein